jgi:hypothetical protein
LVVDAHGGQDHGEQFRLVEDPWVGAGKRFQLGEDAGVVALVDEVAVVGLVRGPATGD